MVELKDTLKQVMAGYAGKALNGFSYLTANADETVFVVISFGDIRGRRIVEADLVVRLMKNFIVVDLDINNKPLVDALVQAGVPRSQIVLAYAGEAAPETA